MRTGIIAPNGWEKISFLIKQPFCFGFDDQPAGSRTAFSMNRKAPGARTLVRFNTRGTSENRSGLKPARH